MNRIRQPSSDPSDSGYGNKRRRWNKSTPSPAASPPMPAPPIPHKMVNSRNSNRNTSASSLNLPIPVPPVKNHIPAKSPPPTIEAILAGQLSNETKRAYKSDLRHFLGYLGTSILSDDAAIIEALCRVNRVQATEYRDYMLQVEGFAAATVTRRLSHLGTLYDILKSEGIISKSPFYRVKRPKVSREGKTPAFSQEQVENILAQPDITADMGKRDRIILLLLFFCGLRRGEVIKVCAEDFFENQGHRQLRIHGKGRSDKSDSVLVPPHVWLEIKEFIKGWEGPLFVGQSRNKANTRKELSASRVYLIMKKYIKQAGYDPTAFSTHSSRVSFVTLCLLGGAGLLQVAYAARHSDPATTVRYDRARMNLEKHASTFLKIQASPSSPSVAANTENE